MDDCTAVLEVEGAAAKASRDAKGVGQEDGGQRRKGFGRVFPEPRVIENVDAGDIVLIGDQFKDRDIRLDTKLYGSSGSSSSGELSHAIDIYRRKLSPSYRH